MRGAEPDRSRPATASPGIARDSFYAALDWVPPLGWRGGVEARALSKVCVNDVNSDAAAGFAIVNANVGYVARVGARRRSPASRASTTCSAATTPAR